MDSLFLLLSDYNSRPSAYPNGAHVGLATATVIVAYALALFSIWGCHYVDVDTTSIVQTQLPVETSLGFGLYTRQNKYGFDNIDQEWEHWRGDVKQTDDVLLIGIKF